MIKLTLFGLFILLIVVIAVSYYMNKEGFDDMTRKYKRKMKKQCGDDCDDDDDDLDEMMNDLTSLPKPAAAMPSAAMPSVVPGIPPAGSPAMQPIAPSLASSPALPPAAFPAPVVAGPSVAPMAAPMAAPGTVNASMSQVPVSDNAYAAMMLQQKSEFLQDLQKIIRNELLAKRSTEPVKETVSQKKATFTDSIAQGKEYKKNNLKDDDGFGDDHDDHCGNGKHCPDMSNYIKKDSIPCWGCSLDY